MHTGFIFSCTDIDGLSSSFRVQKKIAIFNIQRIQERCQVLFKGVLCHGKKEIQHHQHGKQKSDNFLHTIFLTF